jgi:tRNA-splicing ligase RtcB
MTTVQPPSNVAPQYELHEVPGGVPVKTWTRGVPVEPEALEQLKKVARLPIVHGWVAAMPDVHVGIGATVGSVIVTLGAVIPAAVGVDIGCGMMATRTTLSASDLPDSLKGVRACIEQRVPVGRGDFSSPPRRQQEAWAALAPRYDAIAKKHPKLGGAAPAKQLGTLGGGNHFIEVCLDETDAVWFLLHSGSRGIGNRIGSYFIERAKVDMRVHNRNAPDADLAYVMEGTQSFADYVEAVSFAQDYAAENRRLMMAAVVEGVRAVRGLRPFQADVMAVNCHHNYVEREVHLGRDVLVTRKGAVRAGAGDLGIIPGSMGAQSYIVRGRGSAESFHSCSHGAGRRLSRTAARKAYTLEDHAAATAGVECRKDEGVLDETPAAYKPIDAVMKAQADLVETVHTLRQVVCIKG